MRDRNLLMNHSKRRRVRMLAVVADPDESKVYFEVSDFSTSYVFYEAP